MPAFYATLAVLAAGVFWQAAHRANERDEVIDAQAQALANHLTQSGTGAVAAKAPAASPPSTATNDAIIAAQRATKAHLYAAQLAYENAADAVALPGIFDLRPLTSREAIAARRAEVDVFTKAVRLLRETGELAAFQYSSELRDRRVPEAAVRESVAAYREATEKALPRLKRLRDKDGAIALLLDQFLDFAEAELGGWRIDPATDAVEFDRPEARARFDELLQTARVLESERRQLRAEASR